MADPFACGSDVRVREVLHGAEWASWDERVVGDDGTVLATVQVDGTPMVFPPHPVPHPWGHLEALWKDVQDLAPSLASGRMTHDELLATLAAAAEVADLLDCGDRWWAPWDGWAPADGMI